MLCVWRRSGMCALMCVNYQQGFVHYFKWLIITESEIHPETFTLFLGVVISHIQNGYDVKMFGDMIWSLCKWLIEEKIKLNWDVWCSLNANIEQQMVNILSSTWCILNQDHLSPNSLCFDYGIQTKPFLLIKYFPSLF